MSDGLFGIFDPDELNDPPYENGSATEPAVKRQPSTLTAEYVREVIEAAANVVRDGVPLYRVAFLIAQTLCKFRKDESFATYRKTVEGKMAEAGVNWADIPGANPEVTPYLVMDLMKKVKHAKGEGEERWQMAKQAADEATENYTYWLKFADGDESPTLCSLIRFLYELSKICDKEKKPMILPLRSLGKFLGIDKNDLGAMLNFVIDLGFLVRVKGATVITESKRHSSEYKFVGIRDGSCISFNPKPPESVPGMPEHLAPYSKMPLAEKRARRNARKTRR